VTLTPVKDGGVQEEILTLDSEEEEVAEKPLEMWAKELLLKEQSEEYDSEEDPEYVPPSIIYETDKEYDEYSDGGDAIPMEEVEILLKEVKKPLEPPSSYIPIWVPVPSPAEKIARAKEQVENKEETKSDTSGKDTDSNGKKVEVEAKEIEENDKYKKVAEDDTLKVENNKGEIETGLTPIMRKLNVDDKEKEVLVADQDKKVEEGETAKVDDKELSKSKSPKCEESSVPKPKRERKKSKSKGGNGDGDAVDVAKKEGDLPIVTSNGDVVNAEKEEDVKSAIVRNPNIAAGSAKSPTKTGAEKGKNSPSKKNSGKGGQEKSEN